LLKRENIKVQRSAPKVSPPPAATRTPSPKPTEDTWSRSGPTAATASPPAAPPAAEADTNGDYEEDLMARIERTLAEASRTLALHSNFQVTSADSAADGMMRGKDRQDRQEGLGTRAFLNSSTVENWMHAPSAVPHDRLEC